MLEKTEWQSKMDNPQTQTTFGTQDEDKTKIQHNMSWTPLCASKHK